MNFTSYSQIEQAYNQLQFDLALSENTSLFSEMHNYISENIVELPYSEDVFTEAKDGKNFLERIWDMIVGIWNAVKKFVVMIFRAVRQLFTGKSENDKLIEKLENNSEEIADNIQNKPAAEVVKVLTEMFVPEKKEEVKKESVYLSEANNKIIFNNKGLLNGLIDRKKWNGDLIKAFNRISTKIPAGLTFKEIVENNKYWDIYKELFDDYLGLNQEMCVAMFGETPYYFKHHDEKKFNQAMDKFFDVIEKILKLNVCITSIIEFLFDEKYEEGWKSTTVEYEFTNKYTHVSKQELLGNSTQSNINSKILTKLSKSFLNIEGVQNILTEQDLKRLTNLSAFGQAFKARLSMQSSYDDYLAFIITLKAMNEINYFSPTATPESDDFNYYFKFLPADSNFVRPTRSIVQNKYNNEFFHFSSADEIDNLIKKYQLESFTFSKMKSGQSARMDSVKKIIDTKIKPKTVSSIPVKGYRTDIEFYRKNSGSEVRGINNSKQQLVSLPDSLTNSQGSMKFLVSNSILTILNNYNRALKVLNDFKNQVNQVYLRKDIIQKLEHVLTR